MLVVDKPAGLTSHDVVARVRRLAGIRKVGHAGTLDPLATGVLIVGLGRATRLLGHLALADKAYRATIRLGQESDTDDAAGSLSQITDASALTEDSIRAALQDLTGDQLQVPSAVSAVKVGGQRAYSRVRAGEELSLEPRAVHIAEFEMESVSRRERVVDVDVRVECSTGTYVRALARDLGRALGVGGHLTTLRRTRVGCFSDREAVTLADLESLPGAALPVLSLTAVAERVFPTYQVDDQMVAAVSNGRRLPLELTDSSGNRPVAVMSRAGEFLALYAPAGSEARPVAVFPPAPDVSPGSPTR